MVEAVAVVSSDQLQDAKLSPLRYSQINTETKTSGGGEGQPETVALASQTPHTFAGWHVLQHVCLQQAGLLLQSHTEATLSDTARGSKLLMGSCPFLRWPVLAASC